MPKELSNNLCSLRMIPRKKIPLIELLRKKGMPSATSYKVGGLVYIRGYWYSVFMFKYVGSNSEFR